jgi:hypothetical protein
VPELVEQALRSAGQERQRHRAGVEWEAAEDKPTRQRHLHPELGDEVFASTIQASLAGRRGRDELDDAEIERSIREINEAIQRSARSAAQPAGGPNRR